MQALLHTLRYFIGIDQANSQTTSAERKCLAKHASNRRQAVEIGVYEGVTTGTIASVLSADAVLYAVDPFLPGRAGICWSKSIAKRESRRFHPACRIEFVEQFSHHAAQCIAGTFDFIFIDGDHTWDGIAQDWLDWAHRVDAGGIVALHDTIVPAHNANVATLGSHQYFIEHIQHDQRFEIVDQIDSLSVMRRIEYPTIPDEAK